MASIYVDENKRKWRKVKDGLSWEIFDEKKEGHALWVGGNQFYRKRQYREALSEYSKAIDLRPIPLYYGDRAKCFLKLGRPRKALEEGVNILHKVEQTRDFEQLQFGQV